MIENATSSPLQVRIRCRLFYLLFWMVSQIKVLTTDIVDEPPCNKP